MSANPAPMDHDNGANEKAAGGAVDMQGSDEQGWNGVEESMEDPEELRVMFCALDSFS